MILYPPNIESRLGFDRIKQLLLDLCTSDLGRSLVSLMEPVCDLQRIEQLLNETDEQKRQLQSGQGFPELRGYLLHDQLQHAQIEGYQLPADTLFQLKLNLEITLSCANHFKTHSEDYPAWAFHSHKIKIPIPIIKRLDGVFNAQGEIKDGASKELKDIRRNIGHAQLKARKSLESILGNARSQGYTEKDSTLTIRDGKLVLPMHAEHKRRVKGVVVDESATGKTVYLEPLEVLNLNNTIRELQFAEKREINKILLDLSAMVSPEIEDILDCQNYLALLDFTRAKARQAIKLKANKPRLGKGCGVYLKEARHPLLQLAHESQNLPVVPLTLALNPDTRVLIISGPNAGGKSVCLKTVGLLQLMCQSGMLIPAEEDSELGCFDKIFVDIGDQQSIENDLSTYSSHLKNMEQFVRLCDETSLFLIDEFGAGTEPQFGGPIAEAILNYLVDMQAFGVVTTHYSNLKKFADRTPKVENAAMRFDLEKLEPLYQMETGRPGSSFALEIAAKTGLPAQILEKAKAGIGEDPVAFEKLVSQMEQAKQQLAEETEQLKQLKTTLSEEEKTYKELRDNLKEQQRTLINEAKTEAQELLRQANKKIESTIRVIKENKADKSITRAAREELLQFQNKIATEKKPASKEYSTLSGPIQVGDMVRISGSEAHGEVLKVTGTWAEVRIGALKSRIKLSRLQKIGRIDESQSNVGSTKGTKLYQKRMHYSTELDVRGMRGEEALKAVTNFVDEGIMLGMKSLRIIHGKGDGILRRLIRESLLEEQGIDGVKDEIMEMGGDGVTLVTLK